MGAMNIIDLPKHVQPHATRVCKEVLKAPNQYLMWKGKRLNGNRSVITVPVGWSYRMLFKDHGRSMKFAGAYTHEDYNKVTSPNCTREIRPMDPLYPELKNENTTMEQPKQETPDIAQAVKHSERNDTTPPPEPPATKRRIYTRCNEGAHRIRQWFRDLAVGTIVKRQDVPRFGASLNSVGNVAAEFANDGLVEILSRGVYRRIDPKAPKNQPLIDMKLLQIAPPVQAEDTPEKLFDIMLDAMTRLQACMKPCTLDRFSRAELFAELMRREQS